MTTILNGPQLTMMKWQRRAIQKAKTKITNKSLSMKKT